MAPALATPGPDAPRPRANEEGASLEAVVEAEAGCDGAESNTQRN